MSALGRGPACGAPFPLSGSRAPSPRSRSQPDVGSTDLGRRDLPWLLGCSTADQCRWREWPVSEWRGERSTSPLHPSQPNLLELLLQFEDPATYLRAADPGLAAKRRDIAASFAVPRGYRDPIGFSVPAGAAGADGLVTGTGVLNAGGEEALRCRAELAEACAQGRAQMTLVIEVSDPRWGAHLKPGMSWDSDAYDPDFTETL